MDDQKTFIVFDWDDTIIDPTDESQYSYSLAIFADFVKLWKAVSSQPVIVFSNGMRVMEAFDDLNNRHEISYVVGHFDLGCDCVLFCPLDCLNLVDHKRYLLQHGICEKIKKIKENLRACRGQCPLPKPIHFFDFDDCLIESISEDEVKYKKDDTENDPVVIHIQEKHRNDPLDHRISAYVATGPNNMMHQLIFSCYKNLDALRKHLKYVLKLDSDCKFVFIDDSPGHLGMTESDFYITKDVLLRKKLLKPDNNPDSTEMDRLDDDAEPLTFQKFVISVLKDVVEEKEKLHSKRMILFALASHGLTS